MQFESWQDAKASLTRERKENEEQTETYNWYMNALNIAEPKTKKARTLHRSIMTTLNRQHAIPFRSMTMSISRQFEQAKERAKLSNEIKKQTKFRCPMCRKFRTSEPLEYSNHVQACAIATTTDQENIHPNMHMCTHNDVKDVPKTGKVKLPMDEIMTLLLNHDLVITPKVVEISGYSRSGLFAIADSLKKGFIPSSKVGRKRRLSDMSRAAMVEVAAQSATSSTEYEAYMIDLVSWNTWLDRTRMTHLSLCATEPKRITTEKMRW